MKLSTKFAAATLTFALSAAASAQASVIVSDGAFNTPSGGSTFTTYYAGYPSFSSMGPWTVTSGNVDLIGGYWQNPSAGGGSVDLDGTTAGGISQTLTNLNPGNYLLSFSLSGNPEGPSLSTKSLQVSVGNVVDPFTYTLTSSNSDSNMLYKTESVAFTISGTGPQSTTLSFLSTDALTGGLNYYGPVIGNIAVAAVTSAGSVSAVPLRDNLPIFGAALLGMSALGFTRRRQAG